MALADDSKRTPFSTNILKESKQLIEELKDVTGLPISKLTDLAIKELYEKIKTDGVVLKIK